MKDNQKIKLTLIVLFIIANLKFACGAETCMVAISNPSKIDRYDEPVVLKKELFPAEFQNILSSQCIVVGDSDGKIIPAQTDDFNADGKWDELAFLYNFKPDEKIRFTFTIIEKIALPVFVPRAHIHLGVSRERNDVFTSIKVETRPVDHIAQSTPFLYQFEGPGWENDKIAFRSYFDSRNGKDVFGKLIPSMVLDSVGLPGRSYHETAHWGMDVLKVGKSLGAGALALTDGDSLFRLAQTNASHFRVIADGPVRAIFELTYTGWTVKGQSLNVVEQITIWGGKNYFSGKITITGITNNNSALVAGITTLHLIDENYKTEFLKLGNFSGISINNVFSENKDFLALGLLVGNKEFKNWKQAPETGVNDEIIKTSYMVFNTSNNVPVEYHLFAGWEKEDIRFKTENRLNLLMYEEAEKLNKPLVIDL
jgi:hypothetical protein